MVYEDQSARRREATCDGRLERPTRCRRLALLLRRDSLCSVWMLDVVSP